MKRWIILFALLCTVLTVTCAAADEDETGIRILTKEDYVELTPQTATGEDVTAVEDRYPNAERLRVAVSGAAVESQILILAQNNEETPTEANIIYIDQRKASDGGAVSFGIFPKEMKTNTTYYIYLAGSAESGSVTSLKQVASFQYYLNESDPVLVGDVDDSGVIDALDALSVLQHVARQIDLSEKLNVADVDNTGVIDALDSLAILQYVARQITEFERSGR